MRRDGWLYVNIAVYRAVMRMLYRGRYRGRFEDIIRVIGTPPGSLCDLCFGDTLIAEWCRAHGVEWTGVDVNTGFCVRARRLGFSVIEGDVLSADLPRADVYILAGSLYHFHDRLNPLFDRIFARTGRLILSEPVRNVSSGQGAAARWARRATHAGDHPSEFRYDVNTLREALHAQQRRCGLDLRVVSTGRDMLVELTAAGVR